MKICLASWAPFFAGAEVAAERLAIGLREAGHQVLCVVGTDGELLSRLRDLKFDVHLVPTYFTGWKTFLRYSSSRSKLVKLLRHERPAIVHSNDLPTHQLVSDAACRAKVPRVCHHRWFFDGPGIDWFNKFGAQRHLFVSQALQSTLYASSPQLASAPGAVVYDGLALPTCPDAAARPLAKTTLGLDQRQLVLFAGQIIERKGVADVLHAWKSLAAKWDEQAQLVFVGEDLENKGAYRTQMQSLANELGLGARFFGFQRNIPTWLTAADVVLVPSHAEPLGNAVLEAMAHARTVVGGDVGGLPEMIAREETGLLVPAKSPDLLAAAIDRLLGDASLRDRLGQAARKRCERLFSLEAHSQAMLAQYQLALDATAASKSRC